MEKRISATEARIHLGEVMRYVVERREPVIVERTGRPEAVIISFEEYQRLRGKDADNWLEELDAVRDQIRQELGGREVRPPEEIIREMRDEWNEERFGHLR
jgi:prevent-host-death family protein